MVHCVFRLFMLQFFKIIKVRKRVFLSCQRSSLKGNFGDFGCVMGKEDGA